MKLQTKLIVAFLLISVVPLTVVTVASYSSSQRAFRRAVESEAGLAAAEMRQRMDTVTSDVSRSLEHLSTLPEGEALLDGRAQDPGQEQFDQDRIAQILGDRAKLLERIEVVPFAEPPAGHEAVGQQSRSPKRPAEVPRPPGAPAAGGLAWGAKGPLPGMPLSAEMRRTIVNRLAVDFSKLGPPGRMPRIIVLTGKPGEVGFGPGDIEKHPPKARAGEKKEEGEGGVEEEDEDRGEEVEADDAVRDGAAEGEAAVAERETARALSELRSKMESAPEGMEKEMMKAAVGALEAATYAQGAERESLEAAKLSKEGEMAFVVRKFGHPVGTFNARLDVQATLEGILAMSRRDRGEIPFAIDGSRRLYTARPEDRPILEGLIGGTHDGPVGVAAASEKGTEPDSTAMAAAAPSGTGPEGGGPGGTAPGGAVSGGNDPVGGAAYGGASGAPGTTGAGTTRSAATPEGDWVVATRPTPSGITFGIARPIGDSLRGIRRTAGMNLILGLAVIGLAIAGIVPLSRRMTRDLSKLTGGVRRIAQGDRTVRLPVASGDELGQLAGAFNQMAEDLGLHEKRMVEQERIRRELELCRQIQTEMLPRGPLRLGVAEINGISIPAREVGGDFFNYFVLGDDQVALLVGDVSGKGVGAALLMANVQATLRARVPTARDLASLAEIVDREIGASTPSEVYLTLFVGIVDLSRGSLRYVNAGHNTQFLLRARGGLEKLASTGLPVGLLPGRTYGERALSLEDGDMLFFFTDGAVEAQNQAGELFGTKRLEDLLLARPNGSVDAVLARVEEAVRAFRGKAEPSDDATLMALRIGAPASVPA